MAERSPFARYPERTAEELANWEAALDEGMGYKHVGEVFGVSRVTVAKYLPGRGWNRKQIGQHSQLLQRNRAVLG